MDLFQPNTSGVVDSTKPVTSTDKKAALTSDYEMFLKMLTAQMTNQDPLNPVDSSDYAVQLATFSSVEQQVLTNDLLSDLTAQLKGSGLSDLAGYVGRDVRTSGPAAFEGKPVDVVFRVAPGADGARLKVNDHTGEIVQELILDTTSGTISWPGTDAKGQMLPHGKYYFVVESFEGEDLLSSETASTYSRVIEAQRSDGGLDLSLSNGESIAPEEILAMRE